MKKLLLGVGLACVGVVSLMGQGSGAGAGQELLGKNSFENHLFGGNGRTCQTCHSQLTGTVSPADAQKRFAQNPFDALFLFDGSDDGAGIGATRMQTDATVLVTLPVPEKLITLAGEKKIVSVDGVAWTPGTTITVKRGIPSTINTPGLDPVLMLDGRQPTLQSQARDAILGHAQAPLPGPTPAELDAIAAYQKTNAFFSTPELRRFFLGTGPAPGLPAGNTASEKRGRIFFEDVPAAPPFKQGLCGHCHGGAMLNATTANAASFVALPPPFAPIPAGQRFFDVGVNGFNDAGNHVFSFLLEDGQLIETPDPGHGLITRNVFDFTLGDDFNSFKIPSLWNIAKTAPYFHDNSSKTLEAVVEHYARFFSFLVTLTPQDKADIVAYMKLLK